MTKSASQDFLTAEFMPTAMADALIAIERQVVATEMIGPQELTALYAVMAYVADQQVIRQDIAQAMTEAEFSIDHISKLPKRDYRDAMAFLIDLRVDEIRSRR